MLREAELFVMADEMLVEVLGRIRPQDEGIRLPPILVGGPSLTMSQAVARHVAEDARVPGTLDGSEGGRSPEAQDVAATAAAACASARRVVDGDALLNGPDGPVRAGDFLLRSTLDRSLLAHYVAAYLGSTACPLPEELARPLWELTSPDTTRWRALGYFREPMPLPPHVSWRDRFLLTAGHLPHPLGH